MTIPKFTGWADAAKKLTTKKETKLDKLAKVVRHKTDEYSRQGDFEKDEVRTGLMYKLNVEEKFLRKDFFENAKGEPEKAKKTPSTPFFFPRNKLDLFERAEIYGKVTNDLLFFIFYTERNTMKQYYAARSIKEAGWRFHITEFAWFNRITMPRIYSDQHEVGTFSCFSPFKNWEYVMLENYYFEYEKLENTDI